jgi:hypothetical protein
VGDVLCDIDCGLNGQGCLTSPEEEFMPERNVIRGMDHVGITVPDLDAAARFFEEAFEAKPMYDHIK